MLAAHGLDGAEEEPFAHTGFSLATLHRLRRGPEAFILKRMHIRDDWIMGFTDDRLCREAQIVARASALPPGVRTPAVAAARDGAGYAILMRDITNILVPQGQVADENVDTILARTAELHRTPVPRGVPWCDVQRRLRLLQPAASYRKLAGRTNGAALAHDLFGGWSLFERHASPGARRVVRALFADMSPLLRALEVEGQAWLHGDLKFDNIALDAGGSLYLIDWAMTLVAPPALELGWFLAINSRRMSMPLDRVLARYADHAGMSTTRRDTNDMLAVLCGIVLRGWRKALDADEGEPEELRWWCERAEAAERLL